jgi:hypothetical protein
MKDKLEREIAAIGHDDEAESDGSNPIIAITAPEPKADGDLTVIFELPDGTEIERVLHDGQPFADLLANLPQEWRTGVMTIDGVLLTAAELANDLIVDYSRVKIQPGRSLKGTMKLSFALPGGEKRKLRVDKDSTFGEVLIKLELPTAKLSFDGYALNPRQRIMDNTDIEDGDQIDVKL